MIRSWTLAAPAAILLTTLFAQPAAAQPVGAAVKPRATVALVHPLTVVKKTDMDFGYLSAVTAGTAVLDAPPPGAARSHDLAGRPRAVWISEGDAPAGIGVWSTAEDLVRDTKRNWRDGHVGRLVARAGAADAVKPLLERDASDALTVRAQRLDRDHAVLELHFAVALVEHGDGEHRVGDPGCVQDVTQVDLPRRLTGTHR